MSTSQVQSCSVESFQELPPVSTGLVSLSIPAAPAEVAKSQPRETRQERRRNAKLKQKEERKRYSHIAASYSRFSSELQREDSNESQQRKCREAAEHNSHVIPSDLQFSDSATSGTKREREGLDSMLRAAEAGKFPTLYLVSLSRLARESVITLPLLKQLVHAHKVRVICVSEGIDTDRGGWEMSAAVCSIVHEQYVKDLAAHVLRGQEQTVFAGYSVGDWCFGYGAEEVTGSEAPHRKKNAKPRKNYVIRQDHADWVVKIFNWFVDDGRSIRWIVCELNRLKVPKDHRSTTPDWCHSSVVSVLSNSKYIGIWPWGERFNVRDPETGMIKQEFRPEETCNPWTRQLPDLRIIPDELFDRAQSKLEANAALWSQYRNGDGRLNGSSESCNGRNSVRLLHKLLICDACGQPFHYVGKRLKCRGHLRGVCAVKTSILAKVAEEQVLAMICGRIESDKEWFRLVYQQTLACHSEFSNQVPAQLVSKESELRQLEMKIANLLDSIESGNKDKDLTDRLALRRKEHDSLSREIEELKSGMGQYGRKVEEPTEAWVREQLADLHARLIESSPAANNALRMLLNGRIRLVESQRPRRASMVLTGKTQLNIRCVSPNPDQNPDTPVHESTGVSITIEFHELDPAEEQRNLAKQLHDEGLLTTQIAKRLGVSRGRITAILKEWSEMHGQTLPDGRTRRSTLKIKHLQPPLYEALADQVMAHYEQGLLLDEIAQQLKVDRNTITKSVKYWYKSRNLPIPDGRARRKSLTRKTRSLKASHS